MKPIRVLVVDGCPAMRVGLRAMLSGEPSVEVAGEAGSAFVALEQVAALRPDVALLDVGLVRGNALVFAARIRQRHPGVKMIFLVEDDPDGALDGMPAGADSYLLKSASQQEIVDAVLAVSGGDRLLDRRCAGMLIDRYEAAAREIVRLRLGLSDQEVELVRELAAGASYKEIAAKMYLSEITVIRKMQHVVRTLGVANRVQAVAEAVRRGVI